MKWPGSFAEGLTSNPDPGIYKPMDNTNTELPLTASSPALVAFVDWLQKNRTEPILYVDGKPTDYNTFEFMFGPKYIRVVTKDGGQGRSAFCFIDRSNGDVLKTASWKSPAKGARGNIFKGPEGYGVGQYGANYLR